VTAPVPGTAFALSWSGGKDACLALHRCRAAGADCRALITVMGGNGERSLAHGLRREVLQAQTEALGLPWIAKVKGPDGYEPALRAALAEARALGAGAAAFGDIDLEAHRDWEARVVAEAGLDHWLPLWGQDRRGLVDETLAAGYRAMIVALRPEALPVDFLGRILDPGLLDAIAARGVDPSGEDGEFHTLVVDGPAFRRPLAVRAAGRADDGPYAVLDLAPGPA
jgi:uncharacterized protein (TIGR00290 family)